MWEEEETLPKKSKVAAYALGTISAVFVGHPIYIGGFLVLLTDWLAISIGISGWGWAFFFWSWAGVIAAYIAGWIVIAPFFLLLYGIGIFRQRA